MSISSPMQIIRHTIRFLQILTMPGSQHISYLDLKFLIVSVAIISTFIPLNKSFPPCLLLIKFSYFIQPFSSKYLLRVLTSSYDVLLLKLPLNFVEQYCSVEFKNLYKDERRVVFLAYAEKDVNPRLYKHRLSTTSYTREVAK